VASVIARVPPSHCWYLSRTVRGQQHQLLESNRKPAPVGIRRRPFDFARPRQSGRKPVITASAQLVLAKMDPNAGSANSSSDFVGVNATVYAMNED